MKVTRHTFVVITCTIAFLLVIGVNTVDAQHRFGLGYQGVFPGGSMNGISLRGWQDKFGWDVTLFHMTAEVKVQEEIYGFGFEAGAEASAFVLDGRFMYPMVLQKNSKFYIGGELGFGKMELEDVDGDLFIISPMIGTEFFFEDIPELGFNWEVGYKIVNTDIENVELDLKGFMAIVGAHYYF